MYVVVFVSVRFFLYVQLKNTLKCLKILYSKLKTKMTINPSCNILHLQNAVKKEENSDYISLSQERFKILHEFHEQKTNIL